MFMQIDNISIVGYFGDCIHCQNTKIIPVSISYARYLTYVATYSPFNTKVISSGICTSVIRLVHLMVKAGGVVSTLASCARDRGSIPGYAVTQAIQMRL
jgi:hypothetical protein